MTKSMHWPADFDGAHHVANATTSTANSAANVGRTKPQEQGGLTHDEQRKAIWQAVGVIKTGCMHDATLILANMHEAGFVVARATVEATPQDGAKNTDAVPVPDAIKLPTLNDDLVAILGHPNFRCGPIAEIMRLGGNEIKQRSENEQAAVIYMMLEHYLTDPENWQQNVGKDMQGWLDAAKQTQPDGAT